MPKVSRTTCLSPQRGSICPAILLDMASRLEQIGQFHFFGVAQSHFEPVDIDAYLFVEVTIVDR